jgi:hypothetical protein
MGPARLPRRFRPDVRRAGRDRGAPPPALLAGPADLRQGP